MRRALALPAVALVLAGCGATYSDADVARFAPRFSGLPHAGVEPRAFADLAAVTELRLAPGSARPVAVYVLPGVTIERYRSDEDAWRVTHSGPTLRATVAIMGEEQTAPDYERRGNLVFVGERAAIDAALSRLTK